MPDADGLLVLGEPTGPQGMDRGADWQPAFPSIGFEGGPLLHDPMSSRAVTNAEITDLDIVEGFASVDQARAVLSGEGHLQIDANARTTIRFTVPEGRIVPQLRASGGEGALVRISFGDDPENVDLFAPRGFRQDFESYEPFSGGVGTLILEGGERGMALFGLRFLEERPA